MLNNHSVLFKNNGVAELVDANRDKASDGGYRITPTLGATKNRHVEWPEKELRSL